MESDFIARLKENDREAFDGLYIMYARRLLSYAMKHVPTVQDAEDLVQDVFIALWNNRLRIKNEDTLQALLFMSLRNRIVNFHRSRINSPVYSDYVEAMAREALATDDGNVIEFNEFKRRMFEMIGSLTVTEQRVIKLSRFGRKTNREISEILGLSDQTVRNALSTGLRKLREKLGRGKSGELITISVILKVLLTISSVI